MPVYLFTFHAYGTWMPDRSRGYVRRDQGILPPDEELAALYRAQAKDTAASFGDTVQRALIDEALIAAEKQSFCVHYVAIKTTLVHVLVRWRMEKTWQQVRAGRRQSYSRRLNREFGRREWFVDCASRKRVKDQAHFNHLAQTYLPRHSGWKWNESGGYFHEQAK